jgi:hypothetical protein
VFKIIATTDIRIKNQMLLDGFDRIYPQPSQQFIEHFVNEYNNENIITDVLVEYEYRHDDSVPYPKTLDGKSVLKINPDNTINIKSIKDSWNREEVELLISKAIKSVSPNPAKEYVNKWIEENL